MAATKSQPTHSADEGEGKGAQQPVHAAPITRRKPGRPAGGKKSKANPKEENGAAAQRKLADRAQSRAREAAQAYEEAQQEFQQMSDARDEIKAAKPVDAGKLKRAEQALNKARAEHDSAMRLMHITQADFEAMDSCAQALEGALE